MNVVVRWRHVLLPTATRHVMISIFFTPPHHRITFSCLPAPCYCSISLLGCAPRQRLLVLLLLITSAILLLGTYQRQLWGSQRHRGSRVNLWVNAHTAFSKMLKCSVQARSHQPFRMTGYQLLHLLEINSELYIVINRTYLFQANYPGNALSVLISSDLTRLEKKQHQIDWCPRALHWMRESDCRCHLGRDRGLYRF